MNEEQIDYFNELDKRIEYFRKEVDSLKKAGIELENIILLEKAEKIINSSLIRG